MSETRAHHECATCQSYTMVMTALGGNVFAVKCENGHPVKARFGDTVIVEAMGSEPDDYQPGDEDLPLITLDRDEPQVADQLRELDDHVKAARRETATLARSNFAGYVSEHLFPFSAPHNYHPKDIMHLGGVLDYVIFDGLHDVRNGDRDPDTLHVVMADVKYNTSQSSKVQRAVISALNEGRTRGEEWNVKDTTGLEYRRL